MRRAPAESVATHPRRALRAAQRRHHNRQRFTKLASTTAVLAAFTVLGVSVAGGTYALLMDSRTLPGATLTAGTMTLQVNGAAVSSLGSFAVSPTTSRVASFTVTNSGEVVGTLSSLITASSVSALTPDTTARITPVASATACTTGLSGTLGALNGHSVANLGDIAVGQTRTFCLEIGVRSTAPATSSGLGTTFQLVMTAAQKAS